MTESSARSTPAPRPALGRSLAEGLVGGYDLDGPRVRLGLVWFAVLLAGIALGSLALGLALAAVAGAAGSQTAAAWRRVGRRPNQIVAGVGALVLPLSAVVGTAALGFAVIAVAVAALATAGVDRRRRFPWLAEAGLTVQCAVPVGLATASLVLIRHLEIGAVIALVLLVCAYDVGDFLVGTGATTPVEGPIAGIVAVLVVTFAIGVFAIPPFEMASAWVFGGMAAALCPLGQVVATAILPAPDARVPALRRVDSLLLVGPLWTWALWEFLH